MMFSVVMNLLLCIILGILLVKTFFRPLRFSDLPSHLSHLLKVIESTPYAIVSCDIKGHILSWNKGAEMLFGYSLDEVKGKDLSQLIPIMEINNGHNVVAYEIVSAHRTGKNIHLLATVSSLVDESGQAFGFGIIIIDITERKVLEQNLQEKVTQLSSLNNCLLLQWEQFSKMNEELVYINNELNSFSFMVSHDLKAPLRAIALSTDCLLKEIGQKVAPSHLKLLQRLKERALGMQKLLDDLLIYARSGTVLQQPEVVDTYKLVTGVLRLLPIPEIFSVHIDEDLPILITYRIPLQQIFHNLISNAITHYHRPDDGRIQISAKDHLLYTEFSVTDNGPGIAEGDHQKIFNMFYTRKSRGGDCGSGVGLAIVKKFIDHMDGQMVVTAKPGKGSTFTFIWPKEFPHRKGGSSNPLSLRECN